MWQLYTLIDHAQTTQTEKDGRWIPARPLLGSLWCRIKDAWAVLWGKAEAFKWPGGQ